jgi:hypothetical protein
MALVLVALAMIVMGQARAALPVVPADAPPAVEPALGDEELTEH